MTTETRPSALYDRIDAIIAEKSILKHPFYQRWQAGCYREYVEAAA